MMGWAFINDHYCGERLPGGGWARLGRAGGCGRSYKDQGWDPEEGMVSKAIFKTQRLSNCGLDKWAEGTPEAKIPT